MNCQSKLCLIAKHDNNFTEQFVCKFPFPNVVVDLNQFQISNEILANTTHFFVFAFMQKKVAEHQRQMLLSGMM